MNAEGPTDVPSSVPAVGGDKEQQQEAASLAFPVQQCYRSIAHVEHGFMLGRRRYQCPGKESNDAPSPSAPPAATDETPLAYCSTCAHLLSAHEPGKRHCVYCDSPDPWKYPHYSKANAAAPVPAATDDEAALAVLTEALHNEMCKCLYWDDGIHRNFYRDAVVAVVAALHAHGYRIVKDQR